VEGEPLTAVILVSLTVIACMADVITFRCDAITDRPAGHAFSQLDDLARKLVTDDDRSAIARQRVRILSDEHRTF
jgi:hypothetical protein